MMCAKRHFGPVPTSLNLGAKGPPNLGTGETWVAPPGAWVVGALPIHGCWRLVCAPWSSPGRRAVCNCILLCSRLFQPLEEPDEVRELEWGQGAGQALDRLMSGGYPL